jgi:hypothetical protein
MSAHHHLTVLRDFGDYTRGQHIEDEAEVARILKGEHRNHVVKVAADPKPEVAAAPIEEPHEDHEDASHHA